MTSYLPRKLHVAYRLAGFISLVAGAMFSIVPATFAHHSTSAFDASTRAMLNGKVTEVKWNNPHTYILIDVRGDDGVTRNWSVISGTPQLNVRNGWKRDDVKPGDQVIATVHPDRMGRPMGILRSIKLADGRTLPGPREFLQLPKTE